MSHYHSDQMSLRSQEELESVKIGKAEKGGGKATLDLLQYYNWGGEGAAGFMTILHVLLHCHLFLPHPHTYGGVFYNRHTTNTHTRARW